MRRIPACIALIFLTSGLANAAAPCPSCDRFNEPQEPFRIYGNTYYVGTHGLSSVLITSKEGHVLIDGDLPESVPQIVSHIEKLGFRVRDIKLILNSHAHFDHAGGIAQLQKLSGARVVASASGAKALQGGRGSSDDPQYDTAGSFPPVDKVDVAMDGEKLRVGITEITLHYTPGHTPGGTSHTWQSCEQKRCVSVVYADSLNPISSPGFSFIGDPRYPDIVGAFQKSFAKVESLSCDILIAAHPETADLWTKLERRNRGDTNALLDPNACKTYVGAAREKLEQRLAQERSSHNTR